MYPTGPAVDPLGNVIQEHNIHRLHQQPHPPTPSRPPPPCGQTPHSPSPPYENLQDPLAPSTSALQSGQVTRHYPELNTPPASCSAYKSKPRPLMGKGTSGPLSFSQSIVRIIDELEMSQQKLNRRPEEGGREEEGSRIAGIKTTTLRDTAVCAIFCVCLYRMFVCCCLPVHKCVTILSLFDTLIVLVFTYNVFKHVAEGQTDTLVIFALFFCICFLICQLIGTVFVILAPKKQSPQFLWPRMVLIGGLSIVGAITTVVMMIYFSGNAQSMNDALFAVYQFFFNDELTDIEKAELHTELKFYAVAYFILCIVFVLYCIFEFFLLRKLYKNMSKEFQSVPTAEPSAPPPFNPDYVPGQQV